MNQAKSTRIFLIISLFCISLGGYLLHVKIHPVSHDPLNWLTIICGLASIIVIPILFWFKKTVRIGFWLNTITVIIGTLAMAYYSIKNLPEHYSLIDLILRTTFADIIILWGKFGIGKALVDISASSPES
jgi:hypothetical protein